MARLQPLIVELRRNIETFALSAVFSQLNEEDLTELSASVENLREACQEKNLGQVVEHDMAFHRYLVEASGNADLLAVWLPIVSRMMLHYSRHEDLLDSYREHAEIVDAIRVGDQERAVSALLATIQ